MKQTFYFLVTLLLISCGQSKEEKVNELKQKNERLVEIKKQYQDSLNLVMSTEAEEIVSMAEKMVFAESNEQMAKLDSTSDNEAAQMRETIHKKYKEKEEMFSLKIKEIDSTVNVNNNNMNILLELKQ
jgi:hypothetical protein